MVGEYSGWSMSSHAHICLAVGVFGQSAQIEINLAGNRRIGVSWNLWVSKIL